MPSNTNFWLFIYFFKHLFQFLWFFPQNTIVFCNPLPWNSGILSSKWIKENAFNGCSGFLLWICFMLYIFHYFPTLIDKNDFKWKECKKHAGKTRTRLKLKSAYWHVRDCGICCWEIIYGKLCLELIKSECIFHGTIYSFHWSTGTSRKEPFETIWRNKKILMWLDLEQFQRRYWYFKGPERHICSETIKESRNWAFIELFLLSKRKRGWMNFPFSHLRLQTIRHLRQAKSHDAFRMSSTCRKHYAEKTLYNQNRVLV